MTDLDRWRCPSCGRILAELRLAPESMVRVKCKCNQVTTMQVTVGGTAILDSVARVR